MLTWVVLARVVGRGVAAVTLLALVAARLEGGIDRVRALYALAIEKHYRFYSFGDAMLILP